MEIVRCPVNCPVTIPSTQHDVKWINSCVKVILADVWRFVRYRALFASFGLRGRAGEVGSSECKWINGCFSLEYERRVCDARKTGRAADSQAVGSAPGMLTAYLAGI